MKTLIRPKRTDNKYWTGTRNFDHIQFEQDLEEYIDEIESPEPSASRAIVFTTKELSAIKIDVAHILKNIDLKADYILIRMDLLEKIKRVLPD